MWRDYVFRLGAETEGRRRFSGLQAKTALHERCGSERDTAPAGVLCRTARRGEDEPGLFSGSSGMFMEPAGKELRRHHIQGRAWRKRSASQRIWGGSACAEDRKIPGKEGKSTEKNADFQRRDFPCRRAEDIKKRRPGGRRRSGVCRVYAFFSGRKEARIPRERKPTTTLREIMAGRWMTPVTSSSILMPMKARMAMTDFSRWRR